MKRNIIKLLFVFLTAITVGNSAWAQQTNSLYFMQGVHERNIYNPAFQSPYDFYIDLPFSNIKLGGGNNSFVFNDIVFNKNINGIDSTITFLHPMAMDKRDGFFKSLRNTTRLNEEFRMDLLGFGFRSDKNFFTFNISARQDFNMYMPKDFFNIMMYGMEKKNIFDLGSIGFNASAYVEVGLGYSRQLNDKLTVGAKLKYLAGYFDVHSSINKFKITTGRERWNLSGDGKIMGSLPSGIDTKNLFKSDTNDPANEVLDFDKLLDLSPSDIDLSKIVPDILSNPGVGLDLGVTYKILPELQFSAALLDLGFISWTNNTISTSIKKDWTFEGLQYLVGEDENDLGEKFKEEMDKVKDIFTNDNGVGATGKSYTKSLSTRFNAGLEYGLLKDKIGIGLLSSTLFLDKTTFTDLTASVNFRPCNWFQPTLSYSVLDGRMHTLGAGVQVKMGFFNFYVAADNISIGSKSWVSPGIPKYSKDVSLHLGLSMVFGDSRSWKNKDDDGDGVKNKKDRCPYTPVGYWVDRYGCPIDGDSDGIPDNLDQCPDTPAGVVVDEKGCPVDSDGDGVPDYLDRCPDTPAGVTVDENGCPIDSDGDGVPDYLDKCPDTPAAARATVDANGCPKDSDGDGVPDYLDKCPDTPEAAYATVDANGCPKDSDGDGVPDYLDKCPDVAGTRTYNGCPPPELKKQEKEVLEKAAHGVQFESGKSAIKKASFSVLNEIVMILNNNPTATLIVNGHTDNVGKPAANMLLSENRAIAVKKYLLDAGIDESRIKASGYGDTQPLVPNTTKANKEKNRRVEFIVKYKTVE
jgi:outer membrane protein OmpA-like peptidoglycan-associated protein